MSKPTKYNFGYNYEIGSLNRKIKYQLRLVRKLKRQLKVNTAKAAKGEITLQTIINKLVDRGL